MLDIRNLFTRESVVRHLAALPPLKTVVMDTIFANRPQSPLPVVSAHEIHAVINALPLVRRGAPSIAATRQTGSLDLYEPFPIRPNVTVAGMDLNNLKLLDGQGKEAWAQGRTDYLRRAVRKTTEGIAAQALTGRVQWPVQLEGGAFDVYDVNFGTVLSHTPAKKWDVASPASKLVDVYNVLTAMQELLEEEGYGSTVEIWAGATAFNALFKLAEANVSTAKFQVEITDVGINVAGYMVKRRSEKYRNPQTGSMVSVVAANDVLMVAQDADHRLVYCAVDDLDANLAALPLFVKPIEMKDPSGWKLVAESKPFPIPNVRGICKATVTG